jgi:hypothetical protein
MKQFNQFTQWLKFAGVITIIFSLVLHSSTAQAGWFDWLFGSSPVSGTPSGRRTGGGDRSGSCPKVSTPLTALAPLYKTKDGNQFTLGATVSEFPTLWFYLPYEISKTRPAELRVEEHDSNQNYIFDTTILTLTNASPGIIGIRVPQNAVAPLSINGQRYFTFVVRCDPSDSSTNKFVSVSVERIPLNSALMTQLKTSPPKQQAALYETAGIWFETVTTLAELIQKSPGDRSLQASWVRLLKEANLPATTRDGSFTRPRTIKIISPTQ